MTYTKSILAVAGILFLAAARGAGTQTGHAHSMTPVGALHVMSPWSRALPPVSENGAVYLVVENHGDRADALIGASTPIARRATLHATEMAEGVMRMRALEAVAIPPGGHAMLEPGGAHLMLMGLKRPLQAGMRFALRLRFREAGEVEVEVRVLEASASGPAGHHGVGAMHGDHGHMQGGEHEHGEAGGGTSPQM